jgi:hypothetical protein
VKLREILCDTIYSLSRKLSLRKIPLAHAHARTLKRALHTPGGDDHCSWAHTDTSMTTSQYCDVFEGDEGLSSFAFEMEMDYETCAPSMRSPSEASAASVCHHDMGSARNSPASPSSAHRSPAVASSSSSSLLRSGDVADSDSDYDHEAARSALAAWVDMMPISSEYKTPPCRPVYLRGARF